MRIILKFQKSENIRYISHLDLQRLFGRALRRALLPIAYSQGFHPHPVLSFASALAVGALSDGEYADIGLSGALDAQAFAERLNAALPEGVHITGAIGVRDEAPSAMAVVCAARYELDFTCGGPRAFLDDCEQLLCEDVWEDQRTGKRAQTRTVDLLKDIYQLVLNPGRDGRVRAQCLLSSGSSANLSPRAMLDYLERRTGQALTASGFKRLELYARWEGRMASLEEYYRDFSVGG